MDDRSIIRRGVCKAYTTLIIIYIENKGAETTGFSSPSMRRIPSDILRSRVAFAPSKKCSSDDGAKHRVIRVPR